MIKVDGILIHVTLLNLKWTSFSSRDVESMEEQVVCFPYKSLKSIVFQFVAGTFTFLHCYSYTGLIRFFWTFVNLKDILRLPTTKTPGSRIQNSLPALHFFANPAWVRSISWSFFFCFDVCSFWLFAALNLAGLTWEPSPRPRKIKLDLKVSCRACDTFSGRGVDLVKTTKTNKQETKQNKTETTLTRKKKEKKKTIENQ